MLDETREQRFLACHLRVEGGSDRWRSQPISSESLTIGGEGARLRVAEGADRHR